MSRNFYTSSKSGNTIREYSFNHQNSEGLDILQPTGSYQSAGQVAFLFYRSSQLIAVSKSSTGAFCLETISVPTRDAYAANTYQKQIIPLDFIPTQTISDPAKPVLFMTDSADTRLVLTWRCLQPKTWLRHFWEKNP